MGLVLRAEANLHALVVEQTLVGLADGDALQRGLALREQDGAARDGHAVHEYL